MRWPFGSGRQIAWAHALVLLRMLVFGAVLFGLLRPLLTRGAPLRQASAAELTEHAILTLLSIAFVWLLLGVVARASAADLGFARADLPRNLAIGLGVFAVNVVVVQLHGLANGDSLLSPWQAVASYTPAQRLQMLLVAVHVIFGEEILFRGYLQPGLGARFSPVIAVALTALLFAAYHVDFSVEGFATNLVWGLLWGAARERTRSTIPSSVAHFLNWAILGWY